MFTAFGRDEDGNNRLWRKGIESKFVATLLERKAYQMGATRFWVEDDNGNVIYSNTRVKYPFKV